MNDNSMQWCIGHRTLQTPCKPPSRTCGERRSPSTTIARGVAELEQRDREKLRDSLSAVLSVGSVITVARTASPTLRVEFEVLLTPVLS